MVKIRREVLSARQNKKGQIGKLITIFPIMFLIFIIMGIFIFLSAAFSISDSGKEIISASSSLAGQMALSEGSIPIKHYDEKTKTPPVEENVDIPTFVKKFAETKLTSGEAISAFTKFVQADERFGKVNVCLFVWINAPGNPYLQQNQPLITSSSRPFSGELYAPLGQRWLSVFIIKRTDRNAEFVSDPSYARNIGIETTPGKYAYTARTIESSVGKVSYYSYYGACKNA